MDFLKRTALPGLALLFLLLAQCSHNTDQGSGRVISLENGSFEVWADSLPVGWISEVGHSEGPGPSARIGWSGEGAIGDRALTLEGDQGTRNWIALTQGPWPVEPGEIYLFSGWFKADAPGRNHYPIPNCQPFARFADGKEKRTGYFRPTFHHEVHDWQKFVTPLIVPPGSKEMWAGVFLSMPGFAAVDDMRLEKWKFKEKEGLSKRENGWRGDFQILSEVFPASHPAPFRHIAPEVYRARLDSLAGHIKNLSDEELNVELRRAVALLGDPHTLIRYSRDLAKRIPVVLDCFQNSLVAVSVPQANSDLLGCSLVAVEGRPVGEIIDLVQSLEPSDCTAFRIREAGNIICQPGVMEILGVTDSSNQTSLTFASSDGVRQTVQFEVMDFFSSPSTVDLYSQASQKPLYMHRPENYWAEYDSSGDLVYIKYWPCLLDPRYPFDVFMDDVTYLLAQHPTSRIVVDLRNNFGGNSAIALPLIDLLVKEEAHRIVALNGRQAIFLVVGKLTFSSGVLNAVEIIQRTGALVVGEPTRGKPNHCGEIQQIELPYSGLKLVFSTRDIRTMDGEPKGVPLDITVFPSVEEVRTGRDPFLEAILSYCAREKAPDSLEKNGQ